MEKSFPLNFQYSPYLPSIVNTAGFPRELPAMEGPPHQNLLAVWHTAMALNSWDGDWERGPGQPRA